MSFMKIVIDEIIREPDQDIRGIAKIVLSKDDNIIQLFAFYDNKEQVHKGLMIEGEEASRYHIALYEDNSKGIFQTYDTNEEYQNDKHKLPEGLYSSLSNTIVGSVVDINRFKYETTLTIKCMNMMFDLTCIDLKKTVAVGNIICVNCSADLIVENDFLEIDII